MKCARLLSDANSTVLSTCSFILLKTLFIMIVVRFHHDEAIHTRCFYFGGKVSKQKKMRKKINLPHKRMDMM